MNSSPFKNFGACCAGQSPLKNQDWINPNLCTLIRPFDVEVGREMIAIEHQDFDALKHADGWHIPSSLIIQSLNNIGKLFHAKLEECDLNLRDPPTVKTKRMGERSIFRLLSNLMP